MAGLPDGWQDDADEDRYDAYRIGGERHYLMLKTTDVREAKQRAKV